MRHVPLRREGSTCSNNKPKLRERESISLLAGVQEMAKRGGLSGTFWAESTIPIRKERGRAFLFYKEGSGGGLNEEP